MSGDCFVPPGGCFTLVFLMLYAMCFLDIDRILGMGIDPCFKRCRSTWGVGFMNCLRKITVCEPMHYPVVVLMELTLVGKLMRPTVFLVISRGSFTI